MASILRAGWLAFVLTVSGPPIVALLPLPYVLGGVVQQAVAYLGGQYALCQLLLLIGCVVRVCLAPSATRPAAIASARFTAALALAALAALALSSTLLLHTTRTLPHLLEDAFGAAPATLAPPFSLKQWVAADMRCLDTARYRRLRNETVVFRNYEPSSVTRPAESPLYPMTAAIWDAMFAGRTAADVRPSSLEMLFFPPSSSAGGAGDFARTSSGGFAPGVVIFVHGGGWWSGSREEPTFGCHLDTAHSHGWAVAMVEYRLLSRGWNGGHLLSDVMQAVRTLIARATKLKFDASRVVLVGSSAGAHLTLLASFALNRQAAKRVVSAVVALDACTDLSLSLTNPVRFGAWDEAMAVRLLCGGDNPEATAADGGLVCPEIPEAVAPLISAHAPPTFLLHGTMDAFYSPEHMRVLARALTEASVPHVAVELPRMPHVSHVAPAGIPGQLVGYALTHILVALSSQQSA